MKKGSLVLLSVASSILTVLSPAFASSEREDMAASIKAHKELLMMEQERQEEGHGRIVVLTCSQTVTIVKVLIEALKRVTWPVTSPSTDFSV